MKAHTDIDQSKRLAEFLPLESADMLHCLSFDGELLFTGVKAYTGTFKLIPELSVPCWSLTALLNIISIEHNLHGYLTENGMAYRVETLYSGNSKSYDNPIDACYEMIIRLHERTLL